MKTGLHWDLGLYDEHMWVRCKEARVKRIIRQLLARAGIRKGSVMGGLNS
jgi:hypothetical protein